MPRLVQSLSNIAITSGRLANEAGAQTEPDKYSIISSSGVVSTPPTTSSKVPEAKAATIAFVDTSSSSHAAAAAEKTVSGIFSVSTASANTDNKLFNMFPTVGPVSIVSRMDLSLVAGTGEGAALSTGLLGAYERVYNGGGGGVHVHASQQSDDGMVRAMLSLGAQTALWGILFSSLIRKGGRQYAREAFLTMASVALILLQMTMGVEAFDFGKHDIAGHPAKSSFDSGLSAGDAAVIFGGLSGFAIILVAVGFAGAFWIKKGVEKVRKEAQVKTDAIEWAKSRAVDKGSDSRRE